MDVYVKSRSPDRIPNSGETAGDPQMDQALLEVFGLNESPAEEVIASTGMSDEDFLGSFQAAVTDAEDYIDSYIGPLRAEATKYYRGDLFGNEVPGRSQVVMTEVRDSVLGVVPSLLRFFTGGENAVEFIPQNAQSIDLAAQQTDYVNYVLMNDNGGFLLLHNMIKDALTRKTGILKWRWSEDTTVTETSFTDLLPEQVMVLQQDPTVQIVELVAVPAPQIGHNGGPAMEASPTMNVRIRRTIPEKCCIIECIPPEEWLINRDARDANDKRGYNFQAHRSMKTVSEIVAMGYDRAEIEENMGGSSNFRSNEEQVARNPAFSGATYSDNTPDTSMHTCLFIEAYMKIDKDDDGIAELRKIHAIGNAFHILHDEIVDEAPFAVFCPDPEPHMVIGNCVADQTMDIQRIKTGMVRATSDSATGSIFPRTAVVENKVTMDDVTNTEPGAIIRMREAGAVQELTKPFVGTQMLPLINYMDEIKSKRTGLSPASQGLSPEMMQSTTHAAVSATVSGAQERIEMYARIMAETAMRRLFRGIAKTLRENQDRERLVKLRGQWVAVDPRTWVGELECVPNVSMGRGTDAEKLQKLSTILAEQKLIIQQLGPVNPIAGVDRYRETLAQMITLAGFKDASKYIGTVTPEFMQQLQQASTNKPPEPAAILAQAELMKVQAGIELDLMKFRQEQWESMMADEREREKVRMETMAKLVEIEAKNPGQDPNHAVIELLLQDQQRMAEIQSQHVAQLQKNMLDAQARVEGMAMKAQAGSALPAPALEAPMPGAPPLLPGQ